MTMNMNLDTLAERIEQDTRALCTPEGRMVGSAGHRKAEEWVAGRLTEVGCEPCRSDRGDGFALPYRCCDLDFTNFAGVVPGRDRKLPPLLIGAHYDSVIAAPCADDNGVAVVMCLTLAALAKNAGGLERYLLVAIFDAEEPPFFQTS